MLKFREHLVEEHQTFLTEVLELLNEKLVIFRGKRSKYGRVVFLAGGGGSGKGFAMANFLDISSATDKIRDVDYWKDAFLRLDKITQRYPEIRGLDMRNENDVFKLHQFVKSKGIKEKTLDLLLGDLSGKNLPNLVFDVTLKDRSDIESVLPRLLQVGYKPSDIHLVWVLTSFSAAVINNLDPKRGRIVPEKVLLDTHEGAARTMWDILTGHIPNGLGGEIWVINNNRENTIKLKDKDGNDLSNNKAMGPMLPGLGNNKKDTFVVKDFFSLKVKSAGKSLDSKQVINQNLLRWITNNVPASAGIPPVR